MSGAITLLPLYAFMVYTGITLSFYAPSQNCEKRLLASSSPSVRLCVDMGQLGAQWTDFNETRFLSFFFFRKYVQVIR